MTSKRNWWKEGVIYQIYPQSFNDSNGDGIGDLQGIIRKLDYVKSLGVEIIWLNPIYESPLDDNGYDISNYRAINPMYGSMADFDEMLEEMHKRDLRLLMDLVVNHSSDEHRWFVESKKSKDNPYRDYYYWKPGKNGGPPNNWPSIFGGSAWEFDDVTGEYYLHYFTRKQPDLNWENPMVRKEVLDIVKWWLDKGIDGFRLDVISMISKHLDFPDSIKQNFGETFTTYYCNGPRVHEFIHEMYEKGFKHYDVMTVGEGPGITKEMANDYTGANRGELSMIFPLDHMFADWGPGGKFDFEEYDLMKLRRFFIDWEAAIGDDGWMSIFLDNHDFARMVSRFGNDGIYRTESVKLLLTMLLTLRGTPSIHYGSEIGMTNVHFNNIDDYRDVESLNWYNEAIQRGLDKEEAFRRVQIAGRDNVRTPMQWDATENAGFSTGDPWLGVNPNHSEINVQKAESDPESILHFFRRLIAFRKENPVFVYGGFDVMYEQHPQLFAYKRSDDSASYLVLLNMSDDPVPLDLPGELGRVVLSNYREVKSTNLRPWEARIYA